LKKIICGIQNAMDQYIYNMNTKLNNEKLRGEYKIEIVKMIAKVEKLKIEDHLWNSGMQWINTSTT
jgi:L-cysteine desulfidase